MAAYNADISYLRAQHKTYLLQPPPAGPEEAFADMFDWYMGHVPGSQQWGPHMFDHFSSVERKLRSGRA